MTNIKNIKLYRMSDNQHQQLTPLDDGKQASISQQVEAVVKPLWLRERFMRTTVGGYASIVKLIFCIPPDMSDGALTELAWDVVSASILPGGILNYANIRTREGRMFIRVDGLYETAPLPEIGSLLPDGHHIHSFSAQETARWANKSGARWPGSWLAWKDLTVLLFEGDIISVYVDEENVTEYVLVETPSVRDELTAFLHDNILVQEIEQC